MDTDLPRSDAASPDREPPARRKRKPAPKPGMTLETIRTNMAARMAKERLADDESIATFFKTNPRCALHVGELELNIRTTNALVEKAGIERVLELLFCTRQELLAIPGIGETRKKALLRHFGSLEKVKQATVEELATVKGMSKKAAGEMVKFFQRKKSSAAHPDPTDATAAERTGNGEATAQ